MDNVSDTLTNSPTVHHRLSRGPIAILIGLSFVFGINMAVVKFGTHEIAPVFMAAIRSVIAAFCLYIWMKAKGVTIFPTWSLAGHGLAAGLLFGAEFVLVYAAMDYTSVSRLYILLYAAPFFTALGAHFFLPNDRLNIRKFLGLAMAFIGVAILFLQGVGSFSTKALLGDIMGLGAGFFWAATTVYVKKFITEKTQPLQSLFYQVFFSIPLLLLISLLFEAPLIRGISYVGVLSVLFQSIIVVFLCYLVWFELVHRYPVSLIHAFAFFAPLFGVTISGYLILGEPIGMRLVVSLAFICLGLIYVNRQPANRQPMG